MPPSLLMDNREQAFGRTAKATSEGGSARHRRSAASGQRRVPLAMTPATGDISQAREENEAM
jgi:hypothetical protein